MPPFPPCASSPTWSSSPQRLNFRVAAEAQFVTQSTLSAGIKELETLLGVQLVERDTRHVRLTDGGRGRRRARGASCWPRPRTWRRRPAPRRARCPGRCASAPSPRSRPICCPRVLPALRRAYGELKLYLREDLTKRLLERLRAGRPRRRADRAALRYRRPVRARAVPGRVLVRGPRSRSRGPGARASRSGRSTPATCCCWKKGIACATTSSRPAVPAAARWEIAGRGHEPDHAHPDGRRRTGRDAAARRSRWRPAS